MRNAFLTVAHISGHNSLPVGVALSKAPLLPAGRTEVGLFAEKVSLDNEKLNPKIKINR